MDDTVRGAALARFGTLALLLLVWWAVTASGLVAPLFLPGPDDVALRLVDLVRHGFVGATLLQHAGASLARVGLAMLFAIITAIPVGIAMGLWSRVSAALDPLIEFYRPVPPLAYLPLIVIWFGIGEVTKVVLITLAIFAPLAIGTASGVRRVDRDRVRAARSLGASRDQVVWLVIVPSALPDILIALRIATGVGWSTLVAAELVASTRGLGFMVQSASQMLVTDVVVAGIVVIAAIALVIELGLRWLERRFAGWARG
jgi:taurine transport system permease protein